MGFYANMLVESYVIFYGSLRLYKMPCEMELSQMQACGNSLQLYVDWKCLNQCTSNCVYVMDKFLGRITSSHKNCRFQTLFNLCIRRLLRYIFLYQNLIRFSAFQFKIVCHVIH